MDNRFGSVQWRSERQIEKLARDIRNGLGLGLQGRISVLPIYEFALEDMVEDAYFVVVNDNEMHGAEGQTDWHQPRISLAASTYAKLRRGDFRARMTAAHELGHLLMHTQRPVFYYRTKAKDRRRDPEWQADAFAAALLMPANAFRRQRTVSQAMKTFGVSRHAALKRARLLNVNIVDDLVKQAPAQRKRHGSVNRARR